MSAPPPSSALPAEVQDSLDTLRAALAELETQVDQVAQLPPLREIAERAAPMENAQLHTALAYTLDSLYFAYLKSTGVPTESHEVKKELDRVKGYMKKLKTAEQEQKEAASRPHIDRGASERFVRHAINAPNASRAGGSASDAAASGDADMPNADDTTTSSSPSSSSSSSNGGRPTRNPRPLQPSAAAKKSGGELGSSARSLAVKEAPHVLWNKLKDSGGLSSDALVEEFLKKAAGGKSA